MSKNSFFINASKRALFSLKVSAGYDELVRNFFGKVYDPLQHNFKISLQKGVIADNSKIAKVISIFKARRKDEKLCFPVSPKCSKKPCISIVRIYAKKKIFTIGNLVFAKIILQIMLSCN